MSPFCTNCGRDLEESWKICPDCGKILGEGTVPQTHPTTQPQIRLTTQPTPQPHRVQPY
ncbi:MAG: zinc-ribbon domain-containing protein, partial [Candidatus Lokiarchaeota archaeon]|nr:zinc-ribbon domain-containing protein [Candidatus Lokiarchaeota archaeon]